MRIVGSGRYTCAPSVHGNGPVCKITCNHYEDKPPVAEASYRCDINGKWSPDLPHCVRPGSGTYLNNLKNNLSVLLMFNVHFELFLLMPNNKLNLCFMLLRLLTNDYIHAKC